MCQFPLDSHRAMLSHIDARARLMPAPEVEPPEPPLVGVLLVVRGAGAAAARAGAGALGAGRFLVPTSTTRLTGALLTLEDSVRVETSLPSTTVVRTVTVRTPAMPARETFVLPT